MRVMKSKPVHFIGVRFTEQEKEIMDKFVKQKKLSYNQFIREAVFSYLNNVEEVKNKIDFNRISSNINNFQKILPTLIRNIHELYEECEVFKLNKEVYFIT